MVVQHSASRDKIPPEFVTLKDACIDAYRQVFGQKLKAVYAAGSMVRGDLRTGSDADFYGVLEAHPTDSEITQVNELQAGLCSSWCPSPLSDIELELIDLQAGTNPETLRRKVILAVDGCLLWGKPVTNTVFQDYSDAEIASFFAQYFSYGIGSLQVNHPDPHIRQRQRRTKVKIVLRCMDWSAVLEGAPLTSDMSTYTAHVARFVPEMKEQAGVAWSLYAKSRINDRELEKLARLWDNSYKELLRRGVSPAVR